MTGLTATRRGVLLGAAASLAMTGAARAATLAEIKKRGFMTVATEDDYQPFEFTKDGKPTGYDQELLDMFKKEAGFEIHQDIIPWTGILPGVTTGKYDAAVTAILVTQERMKTLDFCSPVVESVDYYLKRKSDKKIQGIKDLQRLVARRRSRQRDAEAAAPARGHAQGNRRQTRQGGVLPGLSRGLPGSRARPRRLRRQHPAQPANPIAKAKPDTFEVGQAVSKPTYIAWAVVKGNSRPAGHAQRVPARRPQGRLDVRPPEEMVRHHFRAHAGGTLRHRLMLSIRPRMGTWDYLALAAGAVNTIAISLLAIAIGTPLGLGLALIRWAPGARPRPAVATLVSLLRATPSVTLVLLVYFALPTVGLEVPRFAAGVATLALGSMAYNCEIWRAALLAFPADQLDAAARLRHDARRCASA